MLAFAQTGLLKQVAQNELAPVSLCLGGAAQCGGQVLCFFGQLQIEAAQVADEAFEPGHAGFGVALRFFDFLTEIFNLSFERRKQRAEFLLAAFGK